MIENAGSDSAVEQDLTGRTPHDLAMQRLFARGLAIHTAVASAADCPTAAERLQRHLDDLDASIRDIRSAIFTVEVARRSGRCPDTRYSLFGDGDALGR
jgi:hypothetical protein